MPVDVEPQRSEPLHEPRARTRRRFDPLVPGVALVALFTYWLRGLDGTFTRDLGVYAYGAQRVLVGDLPYVGIENRAGPLAHLIPVPGLVAARILGRDDFLGMRAWYLLLSVGCVLLAYLVAREVLGSRIAALASAATLLSFQGFIILAATGPREKTPMVLFTWCAIWTISRRKWFLTGMFVSLTTLTLQIGFFPLIAAVVVAVPLLCRTGRLRAFGSVGLGGVVPVAILLVWYGATGHVRDLVDGFLVLNWRYPSANPLLSHAGAVWGSMQRGYGVSLWLLIGGMVALAVLTVVRLLDRTRRSEHATLVLTACTAALLVGILWTFDDIDSWVDASTVLPYAALGIAALVVECEQRLPRTAAVAIGLALVVLPTASGIRFSAEHQADTLVEQRQITHAVLKHVPHATVWSIEAPQVLVLSGKTNPTRYQMMAQGLDSAVGAVWPGGLQGFLQWNLDRHPDFIALRPGVLAVHDWGPVIRPGYTLVAREPWVLWYARKTLPPRVIDAIRAGPGGSSR